MDITTDPPAKASALPVKQWVKSTYSTVGNCVELGELPDGRVAIRNSTDPDGPALITTAEAIGELIRGANAGDFRSFVI